MKIRTAILLALGSFAACAGVSGCSAPSSTSRVAQADSAPLDSFGMRFAGNNGYVSPADDKLYGSIFMAVPPAAAEEQGIRAVHVTAIDGVPTRHEIGHQIRLTAGSHELSFVRPDEDGEPILVAIDIEADLNYWVGWQATAESWEPVIYIVQRR